MLVLSKQYYGRGETPVFLAYIDRDDGSPADPADYAGIRMTHGRFTPTFSGRTLVPSISDLPVAMECFLGVPVDSPVAFEGTDTEPFGYNFIFLPGDPGTEFYPDTGVYRTVFMLDRRDGRIETMTFESNCVEKFAGLSVNFGEIPAFAGTVRTKGIGAGGGVGYVADEIVGITRSVISEETGDILSETPIPLAALGAGAENNFSHVPAENIFPEPGGYFVRFTFWHEDGSPPGVIEIGVGVN